MSKEKICKYCNFSLSEHIDNVECPDYDSICGIWIEAVCEYASTCDGCSELTHHGEMTMDIKTQLGYCPECQKIKEDNNE